MMQKIEFDLLVIDWTSISALGTMLAAIATLCAVIVALQTNKPKVKVTWLENAVNSKEGFLSNSDLIDSAFIIIATNMGMIPVTIKFMGFRVGKTNFIINPDPQMFNSLPCKLEISEDCSVWTEMSNNKVWGLKYKDIAFAVDSFGKMYYSKTSLRKRITRRIWWTIGPSYIKNNPYEK